jgi:imidazolonepropionase-like amidohydrolase
MNTYLQRRTLGVSMFSAALDGLALIVIAVTFLGGASVAAQSGDGDELVIKTVTVLSMTGAGRLENQNVQIRDGKIAAIGKAEESSDAPNQRTIDGSGKFLIPGLIDAHVHISRVDDEGSKRLRDLFLLHGVTTIVNLEGSKKVLALRDRIAAGQEMGPTIVTAGPILRGSDSTTEEQGRRLVAMQHEAGYDLIKVYNPLSEAGYRGVIDEAKKRDIPVAGHAVRSVGIEGALASKQHIVHIEEVVYGYYTWRSEERGPLPADVVERLDVLLDESKVEALARRFKEAGIWVTPNLVAYHGILEQTSDLNEVLSRKEVSWMPESMQKVWQPEENEYLQRDNLEDFKRSVERTYPFLETLTRAFHEAGVPLTAGTDVGIPIVIAGLSLHQELELLVAAGLEPMAALDAATRTAADSLGRPDLGRIEVGARADLVLLSADPSQEISNSRKIELVVVDGRVFDRKGVLDSL